jgi:hypothetical protein
VIEHKEIFNRIPHYSGKVNLLRLEILAKYGGVYSDADSECLRPLDDLPVVGRSWGWPSRNGFIQNATLACEPGDATFTAMVDGIPDYYEFLLGKSRMLFTYVFGSHYITPLLRSDAEFQEFDKDCGIGNYRYGSRVVICERAEQTPETFIVHDCDRSWRRELKGNTVVLQ